jgi:LmbE family N-acetylglucosaminyl deacetylase
MSESKVNAGNSSLIAMAICAHPDDIEFMMAGTLLLLKDAGYSIHYMNLSTGNCGSREFDAEQTVKIRKQESQHSAKILGAEYHESFCNDLEILYTPDLLRRLAAVVREVKPNIVLTQSPLDYMEDHINTSRLAITAAFSRGMPNFETIPSRPAVDRDVTVYHALPYGLCDGYGRPVIPGSIVNTTSVYETKLEALASHKSQQNWLDVSQGLNSYLAAMEEMSLEVGKKYSNFKHAEGWLRHSHLGFCDKDADPLSDALGENYRVNKNY